MIRSKFFTICLMALVSIFLSVAIADTEQNTNVDTSTIVLAGANADPSVNIVSEASKFNTPPAYVLMNPGLLHVASPRPAMRNGNNFSEAFLDGYYTKQMTKMAIKGTCGWFGEKYKENKALVRTNCDSSGIGEGAPLDKDGNPIPGVMVLHMINRLDAFKVMRDYDLMGFRTVEGDTDIMVFQGEMKEVGKAICDKADLVLVYGAMNIGTHADSFGIGASPATSYQNSSFVASMGYVSANTFASGKPQVSILILKKKTEPVSKTSAENLYEKYYYELPKSQEKNAEPKQPDVVDLKNEKVLE